MACRISSLTRDQTLAPCGGSMDSQPPGHQQSSHAFVLHLLLWLFATPCAVAWQAPLTWDFPDKNPRVGCHFLLQGIFSNPELEPMSPVSSALQVDSLPLSHNFTFIISLYGGDLKLHFYKHFIEASFCRMLTEINFVFSVAFFSNTYLGLTLSWPRVKVHPSLRSDCPSQWPSWAKPFKSAPGWHHLSGPWVAFAPQGAWLLLGTQASLSLPSLTSAHLPEGLCFPNIRRHGKLAAGFSWSSSVVETNVCWGWWKIYHTLTTVPKQSSGPHLFGKAMGGWLMLTARLVTSWCAGGGPLERGMLDKSHVVLSLGSLSWVKGRISGQVTFSILSHKEEI